MADNINAYEDVFVETALYVAVSINASSDAADLKIITFSGVA